MYGNGFVNSFFTILDQTFSLFIFFFVMLTHDEHHSIKIQLHDHLATGVQLVSALLLG